MGRSLLLRFLALAVATAGLLMALGYLPTLRWGGETAIPAMLAGCGLSLIASLVGAVPVLWARGQPPMVAVPAAMGSMALRLALVLVMAVAAVLSGWFATKPLLIWVAISHPVLLVIDTWFARTQLQSQASTPTV